MTRKFDEDWVAKHIASLLVSAYRQLAGHWRGSPLGLNRPVAAAASFFYGVSLNATIATYSGWEFPSYSNEARQWPAYRYLGDFSSSLHLIAWRLGYWRVMLMGTLTGIPIGRIANYLASFSPQPPPQLYFPQPKDPSQPATQSPMADEDAQSPQPAPPKRDRTVA